MKKGKGLFRQSILSSQKHSLPSHVQHSYKRAAAGLDSSSSVSTTLSIGWSLCCKLSIMLASRAFLAKQAAAMLTRQPACLAHHGGDWGNWGNTNIAVVRRQNATHTRKMTRYWVSVWFWICDWICSWRFSQAAVGGTELTSMRLRSEYASKHHLVFLTRNTLQQGNNDNFFN